MFWSRGFHCQLHLQASEILLGMTVILAHRVCFYLRNAVTSINGGRFSET